jgi:hypothetical protein
VVSNGGAAGACITDGPNVYGNNEYCTFSVDRTVQLVVLSFNTESGWDTLTVNGQSYSGQLVGTGATPLDGVQVSAGSQITWSTDGSFSGDGFMVCAVASGTGFTLAPTAPPGQVCAMHFGRLLA